MPAPIINDYHDDFRYFQFIKRNPEDENLSSDFKVKIEYIKKVHVVSVRQISRKGFFSRWIKYCVIESDFQYYYTSYPYYYNKLKVLFKSRMKLEYKKMISESFPKNNKVYTTYDKGYKINLRGFIVKKLKNEAILPKVEKSLTKTLDKINLPRVKSKKAYDANRMRKIRLKEKRIKEKRLAELELVKIARLEKKQRREKRKQEKIEREKNIGNI